MMATIEQEVETLIECVRDLANGWLAGDGGRAIPDVIRRLDALFADDEPEVKQDTRGPCKHERPSVGEPIYPSGLFIHHCEGCGAIGRSHGRHDYEKIEWWPDRPLQNTQELPEANNDRCMVNIINRLVVVEKKLGMTHPFLDVAEENLKSVLPKWCICRNPTHQPDEQGTCGACLSPILGEKPAATKSEPKPHPAPVPPWFGDKLTKAQWLAGFVESGTRQQRDDVACYVNRFEDALHFERQGKKR